MKTHQLILATLLQSFLLSSNSKAQTIDSSKIIPINPTTSDTIKIIIYTNSPYTYCGLDTIVFDTTSNQISVSATTQPGDLSSPCFSIDTLTIGVLNAGNYELICELVTITPPTTYDMDTIYFTVQLTNGIQLMDNLDQRIKTHPNPANNWLTISVKSSGLGNVQLEAFNLAGKLVFSENQLLLNEVLKVNVSTLINGLYLFKLIFTDGTSEVFKVSENR